jgi:hypothetical protein
MFCWCVAGRVSLGFSLCRRTSEDEEILRKEFQVQDPTPHYAQASTHWSVWHITW